MNITRIIYAPHRWTKNTAARDKNGNPYPTIFPYPSEIDHNKNIASYSLQGVLTFYCPDNTREQYVRKLSKAIEIYTGKKKYIAEFNDSPSTTYEDIMAVCRIMNKLNDNQ